MNERNFNAVPKAACMFAGGTVEIGSNGDGAKSAPIKLKARSGGAIDHWYWGKVVHDLTGMRVHKPRLTIDYAHNDNEVLGYLNHFDASAGDLVASGALTPWRDDDRASEVMFKLSQGVPYEASIFFGGDGIRIEEVAPGKSAQVNGRQFDGPGVIIREWPLRGVAICPYGADQNTDAQAFATGETVAVQVTQNKEPDMSGTKLAVDDETPVEGEKPVEAAVVESEDQGESKPEDEREALAKEIEGLRAERDAIKAEIEALQTQRDAINAEAASKDEDTEKEMTALKAKLAAYEAGAAPVSANPAPAQKKSAWKLAQESSPARRA